MSEEEKPTPDAQPETAAPTETAPTSEASETPDAGEATSTVESTDASDSAASAPTESEPAGAAAAPSAEVSAEGEASPKASEAAAAPEEGEKKAKKKRKRKKKSSTDDSKQPFIAYFDGHGSRAHSSSFRAGEVVAGLVERVENGAITVDLFGRGTAFVDVLEPHEIAIPPVPVAEESTDEAGESGAAESVEASEATPAMSAEAAPVETESAAAEAADVATEVATEVSTDATETVATDDAETPATEDAAGEVAAPVEAPEPPAVGRVFRGRIGVLSESGHMALVNHLVDREAAKATVFAAREARERIEGVVFGFNRGGFDVLVSGIRTFCPASGMSLRPISDPTEFLGQKVDFTVAPGKGTGSKHLIVSRRGILERELRKHARERMKSLKVGERLKGVVADVRDYGALVDLGDGLDGLVHLSEISWTRGVRPSDAVSIGDEVEVEVLKVVPATRKDRHGKLSLSIRACLPDPWDANEEILKPGIPRKGTVVGTTEFGAFIELAPGIEGLLHISELGGKDLKHARDVLSDGEEIDVVVDRVDRGQRRLGLSRLSKADLEAIEKGELDLANAPRNLKPGSYVNVVIDRVEHHGIFVQIKGLVGKRGRGYLPNRELPMSGDKKRTFAPGSEHEVKIIGTERDGGFKVSVKGKLADEERKAVREYRKEASKQGFGTFGDLLKAKLGKDD